MFNQLFSPTYNDKAAFLLKGIGAAPYFIEVTISKQLEQATEENDDRYFDGVAKPTKYTERNNRRMADQQIIGSSLAYTLLSISFR
ncbi:hypothetical protein [Paenibacillus solanacearum]|uniref:hypothetical protein n=1 Tax=Paenibacillus solanacearum TaxID=2048548 RepID=UPI001C404836|nr:hypothetical protein [Paenibacillus solanacearum]